MEEKCNVVSEHMSNFPLSFHYFRGHFEWRGCPPPKPPADTELGPHRSQTVAATGEQQQRQQSTVLGVTTGPAAVVTVGKLLQRGQYGCVDPERSRRSLSKPSSSTATAAGAAAAAEPEQQHWQQQRQQQQWQWLPHGRLQHPPQRPQSRHRGQLSHDRQRQRPAVERRRQPAALRPIKAAARGSQQSTLSAAPSQHLAAAQLLQHPAAGAHRADAGLFQLRPAARRSKLIAKSRRTAPAAAPCPPALGPGYVGFGHRLQPRGLERRLQQIGCQTSHANQAATATATTTAKDECRRV